MKAEIQKVHVVDDDEAIRDAISMLMDAEDIPCSLYSSADDFLQKYSGAERGCLVLDIRMSGCSGLELQAELAQLNSILPIIFITGHGDLPMAVEAMRLGAKDFLRKPIDEDKLITRIKEAFEHESDVRKDLINYETICQRLELLTKREMQVFDLVTMGKTNKLVAAELNISEKTVEIHRANVMQKTKAESVAQLVRMRMDAER